MKTSKDEESSIFTSENLKLVSKFSITLRKPDFQNVGHHFSSGTPVAPPSSFPLDNDEPNLQLAKKLSQTDLNRKNMITEDILEETDQTLNLFHARAREPKPNGNKNPKL